MATTARVPGANIRLSLALSPSRQGCKRFTIPAACGRPLPQREEPCSWFSRLTTKSAATNAGKSVTAGDRTRRARIPPKQKPPPKRRFKQQPRLPEYLSGNITLNNRSIPPRPPAAPTQLVADGAEGAEVFRAHHASLRTRPTGMFMVPATFLAVSCVSVATRSFGTNFAHGLSF